MIMKNFVAISIIALLSSCSLLPNKDIKQQEKQDIERVQKESDTIVSDANKHIEAEITNAIGVADETIESAQSTIKTTVSAEIESQSAKLKQEMNSEIRRAKIVGHLGILFGLVGFVCALYTIFKTNSLRDKLKHLKIRNKVEKVLSNSTFLSTTVAKEVEKYGSVYATKKELNEIKSKIGVKTGQYEVPYRRAEPLSKPVQTGDSGGRKEQNVDSDTKMGDSNHGVPTPYVLYANETSTMAISEIYEKYQPGSSIYRLILDRPDSNVAVIELCTDHADAKRRITKNDDSLLSSICDIKRISEDPKEVIILDKGSVEKIGKSEWKVVKKIQVELR